MHRYPDPNPSSPVGPLIDWLMWFGVLGRQPSIQDACEFASLLRCFPEFVNASYHLPPDCYALKLWHADGPVSPLFVALHLSGEPPDLCFARLLVAAGARVSDLPHGGACELGWAVYYTDVEFVRFLVTNGATPDKPDAMDMSAEEPTPFFAINCWDDRPAENAEILVDLLIAGGSDINRRANGTGFTALHMVLDVFASPTGVRLLLRNGADPRIVDANGRDARAFAQHVKDTYLEADHEALDEIIRELSAERLA